MVPGDGAACLVKLAGLDQAGNLGGAAAREDNKPIGVLGQCFFVNARLVVEAFQLGDGRQTHQVMVAGVVLGQQDEVIGLAVETRVPVLAASGCHISLHPDDGLDAGCLACLIELDRAVHCAVVGEGQGWHVQFDGALGQFPATAEAVEERVFAVYVEVDEVGHQHELYHKPLASGNLRWWSLRPVRITTRNRGALLSKDH